MSEVQSGSPAEKAGLKQGDVVLSFDGQEIERVGALSRAVAAVDPGKTAELVVWRDGKEQRIQAEIGLMPARSGWPAPRAASRTPTSRGSGSLLPTSPPSCASRWASTPTWTASW